MVIQELVNMTFHQIKNSPHKNTCKIYLQYNSILRISNGPRCDFYKWILAQEVPAGNEYALNSTLKSNF